ncbi:nuclear transport factor 2 family protein [Acidovorax sp. LjRoot118]|uniref:nuclear transport factor 2 family protein n=1 Tax=Acidovorax sp. LjRoot118 TaxID=3342256 RepID=UPI003F50492F
MMRQTLLSGAMALGLLLLASPAMAGLAEDAAAASVDIYARMTAKDAPGFLRYRPPGGFTEFTPSSKELQRLELKPFTDLFSSDMRINLRAEDIKVQLIGDVAVVTGTRIGYVAAPNTTPVEVRYALTMVWARTNGALQLQHLHYSPLAAR